MSAGRAVRRVGAAAALALALAACGRGTATPEPAQSTTPPPVGAGAEIGVSYPYDLFTRCGVLAATFDGREWDAAPPLTEGQSKPPPGWATPYQYGAMTLVSRDEAEFHTAPDPGASPGTERTARFLPRKPGSPDPTKACPRGR